jgi:hypothetical protein
LQEGCQKLPRALYGSAVAVALLRRWMSALPLMAALVPPLEDNSMTLWGLWKFQISEWPSAKLMLKP